MPFAGALAKPPSSLKAIDTSSFLSLLPLILTLPSTFTSQAGQLKLFLLYPQNDCFYFAYILLCILVNFFCFPILSYFPHFHHLILTHTHTHIHTLIVTSILSERIKHYSSIIFVLILCTLNTCLCFYFFVTHPIPLLVSFQPFPLFSVINLYKILCLALFSSMSSPAPFLCPPPVASLNHIIALKKEIPSTLKLAFCTH